MLRAYDLPIAKGDEHASLHLLFSIVRQHSTVALSGECGDEVFGGYRWQRDPDAVFSTTFPGSTRAATTTRGNEVVFTPDLPAKLDLATYERDCHSTAVAEIDAHRQLDDPAEARYREVTYLALTRHAQVLFDRKGPHEYGLRPGGTGAVRRPPAGRVHLQRPVGHEEFRRPGEEPAARRHEGPAAPGGRPARQDAVPVDPGRGLQPDPCASASPTSSAPAPARSTPSSRPTSRRGYGGTEPRRWRRA
ncbi:asparagine synthase-related protein [Streptomyces tricolor]|nr:asparagine synthase-related protein [Streptomyces tricolor]